jgi:hypothetical protein
VLGVPNVYCIYCGCGYDSDSPSIDETDSEWTDSDDPEYKAPVVEWSLCEDCEGGNCTVCPNAAECACQVAHLAFVEPDYEVENKWAAIREVAWTHTRARTRLIADAYPACIAEIIFNCLDRNGGDLDGSYQYALDSFRWVQENADKKAQENADADTETC